MNRLSFMLLLVFGLMTSTVQAANNDKLHVKVYLVDGTVGEYYVRSMLNYLDSMVYLSRPGSDGLFSKRERVRTSDVDSIVGWYDDEPQRHYTWVREYVNIGYDYGNPRTSPAYPSLVLRLFRGNNLSAFFAQDPWFGERILYKTRHMPRAKAIYKPNAVLTKKDRRRLITEFEAWPVVVEYLRKVSDEEWTHNPVAFLRLLDEQLEQM